MKYDSHELARILYTSQSLSSLSRTHCTRPRTAHAHLILYTPSSVSRSRCSRRLCRARSKGEGDSLPARGDAEGGALPGGEGGAVVTPLGAPTILVPRSSEVERDTLSLLLSDPLEPLELLHLLSFSPPIFMKLFKRWRTPPPPPPLPSSRSEPRDPLEPRFAPPPAPSVTLPPLMLLLPHEPLLLRKREICLVAGRLTMIIFAATSCMRRVVGHFSYIVLKMFRSHKSLGHLFI